MVSLPRLLILQSKTVLLILLQQEISEINLMKALLSRRLLLQVIQVVYIILILQALTLPNMLNWIQVIT